MKWIGFLLILCVAQISLSEERTVTGTVTYVAAGSVYTSLGRENGVKDSTLLYVRLSGDTIGVLRVFAVSSKSSVCRIVNARREIARGNQIISRISVELPKPQKPAVDSLSISRSVTSQFTPSRASVSQPGAIELRGRVSAQYYMNLYDNSLYNTAQPGVVINLRARSTDIPLKFELYASARRLSLGKTSPFSEKAVDQSRIYRLSLGYNDGRNDAAVGRIIPEIAPTVGYIDGAMYSRRFGLFVVGTALGYQPSFALRGISTDFRKVSVFAGFQRSDSVNFMISTVYARTYYKTLLDREVVSGNVSVYTREGLQVYAYSEVDLRELKGGKFELAPSLTSVFGNVAYRFTSYLSLGIGADATRPLYTYSTARWIPDSLRESRLRTGLNSNITLYLPWGVTLSNSYSPRTSESRFGRVYSNYAFISVGNLFQSGVSFRSNYNLNANEYSRSNGYGVSIQRNFIELVDINVRYQQNNYLLTNYPDMHISRTYGSDLIVNLTRAFAVMMSYDHLAGYGITSNSIFGELSVRF